MSSPWPALGVVALTDHIGYAVAHMDIDPFSKLVQYVASGIGGAAGTLFAPLKAKFEGKALEIEAKHKANALSIIVHAHDEAQAILDKPDSFFATEFSINDSIESVINFQSARRIGNIASVTYRSAELLSDSGPVPDHEPNHDWTARFFDEVQNVSSEQMQELWATVLAGEIETPDSISLRTLDILRSLNEKTARLFELLCSISIAVMTHPKQIADCRAMSLGKNAGNNALREYGLSFADLNVLNEHGLVIPDFNSWFPYESCLLKEEQAVLPLRFGSEYCALRPLDGFVMSRPLKIHGVALTAAGRELSTAVDITSVPAYDNAIRQYFQSLELELVPFEPNWGAIRDFFTGFNLSNGTRLID